MKENDLVISKHRPDITLYGVNSLATNLIGYCYLNLDIGKYNFSKVKVYIIVNKEIMTFTIGQNALVEFQTYSFTYKLSNLVLFKCPKFNIDFKMMLNIKPKSDNLVFKLDQIQSFQENKSRELEGLISKVETKLESALNSFKNQCEEIINIKKDMNSFNSSLSSLKSSVEIPNQEYLKGFKTFDSFLDFHHINHEIDESFECLEKEPIVTTSVSTQTSSFKTSKNKQKFNDCEVHLRDLNSLVSQSDNDYTNYDPQCCFRDAPNAENLIDREVGQVYKNIEKINTGHSNNINIGPISKTCINENTALELDRSVCGGSPRDDNQNLNFLMVPHKYTNDVPYLKQQFTNLFNFLLLDVNKTEKSKHTADLIYLISDFLNLEKCMPITDIIDKIQSFYHKVMYELQSNQFNFILTVNNLLEHLSQNLKKPS